MGGPAIVRIEHNDSDRRFRDKVNSNFSALSTPTQLIGVPADVEDAIATALAEDVATMIDTALSSSVDPGGTVDTAIDAAIEAKMQCGTNVPAALALDPGATIEKTVTFPQAFTIVPVIVLTSYSPDVDVTMVSESETGFTYKIKNLGSVQLTAAPTNWIAMVS